MSRSSNLIKNTAVYFIGNFASKVLAFLLLPLYTHKLQSDEFGYVNLLITAASFLIPIFSFQIIDAAYRFMLDSNDEKTSKVIISNTLIVYFVGILVFVVTFIPITVIFKIKFGILLCLYISVIFLFQLIQQLCRGLKRNSEYALSGMILTFVQAMSNIVFIVLIGMRSVSLIFAPIIACAVGIIFLELRTGVLRKFSIGAIDKKIINELLRYSIPLIPNSMSWWLISSFGTYFLTYYTGSTNASGILEVSNKFPTLITMLNSIFFLAWQESAITEYKAGDRDVYYSKMFDFFSKLQLSLVIVAMPLIKIYINKYIGDDFKEAWIYVPPMLLAAVFSSYSNFIGTGYMSTKKTKGAFKTTIVAALLSVLLNVLLIPQIGLIAVSISSCLAYFVFWIIRIFDTKKFFDVNINYKSMLIMFIYIFGAAIIYYLFDSFCQFIFFIFASILVLFINKILINKLINNFLIYLNKHYYFHTKS
jgi:O-antigen/teichoic acid export membrane protein